MLVALLDLGQVVESKLHGGVVDLVRQDNVTAVSKAAVGAHLNVVVVVVLHVRDRFAVASSPVARVKVPEDGGQVQLGSNPSDTVVDITESLNTRKISDPR